MARKKKKIEPRPLSVRIDPAAADFLSDYALKSRSGSSAQRYSQGAILERLVLYFESLPADLQTEILEGKKINFLTLLGSSLECAEWGDHALRRMFVVWAIETYTQLFDVAQGIKGIQRLAIFKLGSAWLYLAEELRKRALLTDDISDSQWNEYYDAALHSLRIAFAYFRGFNVNLIAENKESPPHPALVFNQACSCSLYAQFHCERTSRKNGDFANKAREELKRIEKASVNISAESGAYVEEMVLEPEIDETSARASQAGLDLLRKIDTNLVFKADSSVPIVETHWIVEYAKGDSDLAFIRALHKKEFEDIISAKEKDTSILMSYKRIRELVPEEILACISSNPDDWTEEQNSE